MSVDHKLLERADHKCELCRSGLDLSSYAVAAAPSDEDASIVICSVCLEQLEGNEELDEKHWRCLADAIWNENNGVKVTAWRILKRLLPASWAQDILDMVYLDEDVEIWAKEGLPESESATHFDSNGHALSNGDTVVLIKDLKVKGANFTAKRGTAVRRISLVHDNVEQIEGRVEGQHIVILTQYVKKSK